MSTRLIFKYTPKKLNEAALTEDDDKLDLADNANKEQESESEVALATENIDLSKLQKSLSELKETLERKKAELEQSVTAAAGDESPDEEAKKRLDTKQDCVNIANELEKSVNKIEEFLKKVFADELTQLKINLDNSKELANLSDTIMESSATIDRIDLKAGDTDSLSDVKKILQDTNDKLSKLTDEFVKIAGQSIDKTNEKNREYHDLKDKRTSMLQNAIKAINPDYAKDANVSANMKKIFSGRSFKQEVEQLGDSEKTNPFIAYLKTLASKNLLNLLDEGKYAAIHNAYVDKSIYPNDLKTTNIGSTSIENCGILLRTALLNKGIWDISNTLKWYGKLKKSLNKELHPIGETGSTYQGVTIPSDGAHLTGEIAYDILFKGDEFRTVDQIEKI